MCHLMLLQQCKNQPNKDCFALNTAFIDHLKGLPPLCSSGAQLGIPEGRKNIPQCLCSENWDVCFFLRAGKQISCLLWVNLWEICSTANILFFCQKMRLQVLTIRCFSISAQIFVLLCEIRIKWTHSAELPTNTVCPLDCLVLLIVPRNFLKHEDPQFSKEQLLSRVRTQLDISPLVLEGISYSSTSVGYNLPCPAAAEEDR